LELSETVGFVRFEEGRSQQAEGQVVRESLVRLHVNGIELARMMCTPQGLDRLALGFLRSEGIIQGMADVRLVKVCPSRACVDVWLRNADFEPPGRPVITSGCGGGITFADLTAGAEPLVSELRVSLRQIGRLMGELLAGQQTRGIHTAALADGEGLVAVAEDVGRHNTLDKLWGQCLMEGLPTQDRILLSTGRISSEMLNKAARMRVPVVVSRTSPTTMSVALANAWDITLVGYARRTSLNVYAGRGRIIEDEEGVTDAYS
jgi:FdhD protein